jgi:endonuclease YncB( thermonuclease family)
VPPGAPAAMRVTHSDSRWAKHAASALVFGKDVTLQTHGHDKYKRTLADVLLPDGTNLDHTLVKDGWCWRYRKYAPGDTRSSSTSRQEDPRRIRNRGSCASAVSSEAAYTLYSSLGIDTDGHVTHPS